MLVRAATEADAAGLPAIERSAGDAFREFPGLEWIADDTVQSIEAHLVYARAGWSWVVSNDEGEIVGFLSGQRFDAEFHIWELAVRRDQQGRGAGRELLDAAIAYARAQNLAAVTLTTFRSVPWNEPLYAHFGFITLGAGEVGERLGRVLDDEKARGLPPERRCAMRLNLLG
jgi:ribosomal protein S18 acetylase RimI-like enzyme